MRRSVVIAAVVGILMAGGASRAAAMPQAAQAAPQQISTADAAPFLGDWVLTGEGQQGPATFNLNLKVDGGKVVGVISSDQQAATTITDVTKNDKALLLRYSFDYNGMAIQTELTLTPAEEGKVTGTFDFASGAYVMNVTGTKKPAAK